MPSILSSQKGKALPFSVIIIIAAFIFFTLNHSYIYAQYPLEKAQEDYSSEFTKYRDAEQTYQNSKAAYKSFQTVAAKNEVFLKTKDYLFAVSNLYLAYIDYLRETANNIDWQDSPYQKEAIQAIINEESNYFADNKDTINETLTLEQLPQVAQAINSHITSTTNPKTHRILSIYEYTRSNSHYNQFKQINQKLTDKIKTKNEEGTSTLLSNWQSEIYSIDNQTKNSLNKAKIIIDQAKGEEFEAGHLDQITRYTQQANDQIKRSIRLFIEILEII